jgi:hypothetical protein
MSDNDFEHMSQSLRDQVLPSGTFTWGENIAWTSDADAPCAVVHRMLMDSPGHRANILSRDFGFVALGANIDGAGTYVTELFFDATGYQPSWDGQFWDDDDSVFKTAIETLASSGITNGCNPPANDRFCPERSVTRAEMAAFLVRAFDLGAGSGSDVFQDDDGVLENAIDKLAAAGITTGCNPPANDRFCPNQPVTRGEMAVFLTRALGLSPITPPT